MQIVKNIVKQLVRKKTASDIAPIAKDMLLNRKCGTLKFNCELMSCTVIGLKIIEKNKIKLLKCLLIVMLFAASTVWAGDVEDARAAFGKKDYVTALKKFKSAALKNDALSQSMLGVMYYIGQGVVQNYAEEVRWYKLAATQGRAGAQSMLGVAYYSGQGVLQNYVRAHMWSNIAATTKDEYKKKRDAIAKAMTSQQIANAQKIARECQARKFKNCD